MRKVLLRAAEPAASLWILMLLALTLRLVVVALTTGAGYDIMSYAIQAESVLTRHNVYTFTDRYPYPPVWVWLVALAQWTANTTGLPFDKLVRLPGIVGDVLIVALLQRHKGTKAALFYALNPVSILITAGHGQFDGLVMALVVAAWALWDTSQRRGAAWAALALGGAIALKSYPVLLLPALLAGAAGWKQRAALIGLAMTPLLVCVLVYSAFFGLEGVMISRVLGYQSPAILGWSLYLDKLLPQLALLPGVLTRIALLLFPVLLALCKPAWSLESLWLATFLGFYILAPGLSPQYLLWALPLLAVVDLKKGLIYTTLAVPTLVLVYLWGFPEAIPWGPALTALTPSSIWKPAYWAANLAWWLACIWLLYSMFQGKRSASIAAKGHDLTRALSLHRIAEHIRSGPVSRLPMEGTNVCAVPTASTRTHRARSPKTAILAPGKQAPASPWHRSGEWYRSGALRCLSFPGLRATPRSASSADQPG